ncbi:MAG: AAA family ATPase [Firmicutes bacterium]|nr:AAA family ATPase [Bacillota bacterium]
MGKIIAVVNQKGGVGKTTTAVNVTASLTALGKKILLVDFDPQANATSGMGIARKKGRQTVYNCLLGEETASNAIVHTAYGDVLPSSADLAGAAVELVTMPQPHSYLRVLLERLRESYDAIFIDCPPSLELLTLNALAAADGILVPVQCEYYALEGLSDLMNTLRMVKKRINPRLEIFGVVLTMFDGRTNFSNQVAQEVRRHFPGKVYSGAIPRSVRLAEAPSHGVPITVYDRAGRGCAAYRTIAEQIRRQLES